MNREIRYTVIKNKDIHRYLTMIESSLLVELCKKIDQGRFEDNRESIKCVVVEHDWPEYESTWKAIAARIDSVNDKPDRNDFPRFTNVYCSNCGAEFGPGDHGFSHCKDHKHLVGRR